MFKILNEYDMGSLELSYPIYEKYTKDMIVFHKKLYPTINNIKIFRDPFDKKYELFEKNIFEKFDIKNEFDNKEYICGKFYHKEKYGKDYMVIFVRSMLLSSIEKCKELYKTNFISNIDDVYKSFLLSLIMHEHMHWYQIRYFREVGGEFLVEFILNEDYQDYDNSIMEKEAFEYETIALSKYIHVNNTIITKYNIINLNILFKKEFKHYILVFESFGNFININVEVKF